MQDRPRDWRTIDQKLEQAKEKIKASAQQYAENIVFDRLKSTTQINIDNYQAVSEDIKAEIEKIDKDILEDADLNVQDKLKLEERVRDKLINLKSLEAESGAEKLIANVDSTVMNNEKREYIKAKQELEKIEQDITKKEKEGDYVRVAAPEVGDNVLNKKQDLEAVKLEDDVKKGQEIKNDTLDESKLLSSRAKESLGALELNEKHPLMRRLDKLNDIDNAAEIKQIKAMAEIIGGCPEEERDKILKKAQTGPGAIIKIDEKDYEALKQQIAEGTDKHGKSRMVLEEKDGQHYLHMKLRGEDSVMANIGRAVDNMRSYNSSKEALQGIAIDPKILENLKGMSENKGQDMKASQGQGQGKGQSIA